MTHTCMPSAADPILLRNCSHAPPPVEVQFRLEQQCIQKSHILLQFASLNPFIVSRTVFRLQENTGEVTVFLKVLIYRNPLKIIYALKVLALNYHFLLFIFFRQSNMRNLIVRTIPAIMIPLIVLLHVCKRYIIN